MFELCLDCAPHCPDNAGTFESVQLEDSRYLTQSRPDEGNREVCLFALSLLLICLRYLHSTLK